MSTNKFVVDTNVIISAALSPNGASFKVLEFLIAESSLLFSDQTYAELVHQFSRSKFDKWVSADTRLQILESVKACADWTKIAGELSICRDPKDDKFLETAFAGRAEVIITGDQDLLVLHPFENIPILTPKAWLDVQTEIQTDMAAKVGKFAQTLCVSFAFLGFVLWTFMTNRQSTNKPIYQIS